MDPDLSRKVSKKKIDSTKDVSSLPWGFEHHKVHDAPPPPTTDIDPDLFIESLLGPNISKETSSMIWGPTANFLMDTFDKLNIPAQIANSATLYANYMAPIKGDPSLGQFGEEWMPDFREDTSDIHTDHFDFYLKEFETGTKRAPWGGNILLPWIDHHKKPVNNAKSGAEIASELMQSKSDLIDELEKITKENSGAFQFGFPVTPTGADLLYDAMDTPEWLKAVGELSTDPLWGTPTKLRYIPIGIKQIDKILTGKYIPNIVGGFDWQRIFTPDGRLRIKDEAVIDQIIDEATKLDQRIKDGTTEFKEGVGFIPKRTLGHYPVPDIPIVKRFLKKVEEAVPLTEEQKKVYTTERNKRIAALEDEVSKILRETDDYPDKHIMDSLFRKHLSGEMDKVNWTPLVDSVSDPLLPSEVQELTRFVRHQGGGGFEFVANMQALYSVIYGGALPQPRQIARLERLFGTDFAKSIVSKEGKLDATWRAAIDVLGIPRTLVSSFDLSAPLRQGRVLGRTYPEEYGNAFIAMHKSVFSEANAVAIEESIKQNRFFAYADQSGLHYSERTGVGAREEAFMSRYIKKVPLVGQGVEASERAYTIFLNKFRHDVFYKTVAEWHATSAATGKRYEPEDYENLAKMINYATGRGPGLGNSKWADIANAAFFAPRFATSQLAFLYHGGKMTTSDIAARNMNVSAIFAESLVGFVQSSMMWLHMLDLAGADLELDPRSSDFGKGKFGDHRFDFFAGYLPITRYVIQLGTGEKKSSMGDIYEAGRLNALGRFLESKMSPSGAAGYDLYSGENFLGEELDLLTLEGWKKEGIDRLLPMLAGDIVEAWSLYDDPSQMINAAPTISSGLLFSLYGGGFQSYESTADFMDRLANEIYPGTVLSDHAPGTESFRNITQSTAAIEYREQFSEDLDEVPGREAWHEDIGRYQYAVRNMLETDATASGYPTGFINAVNSFPYGKRKRFAIESFFDRRSEAWDDTIRDHGESWKEDQSNSTNRDMTISLLREKYWSIPLGLSFIVTDTRERLFNKDYEHQTKLREDFLADLVQKGIVETHIDGTINRNGTVYNAIVSPVAIYPRTEEDPEKKQFSAAVEEWREDEEFLRNNYFSLDQKYFQYPDITDSYHEYGHFMSTGNDRAFLMGNPKYVEETEKWADHDKAIKLDRKYAIRFGWGEYAGLVLPPNVIPNSKEHQALQRKKADALKTQWLLIKWGYHDADNFFTKEDVPPDLKNEIMKRYRDTFGTMESQQEQFILPEHLQTIVPAFGGIKMGSSEYR